MVLWHAFVDFVGPALALWLGSGLTVTLLSEGWVTIAGLFSLWIIWRLHTDAALAPVAASPDANESPNTDSPELKAE